MSELIEGEIIPRESVDKREIAINQDHTKYPTEFVHIGIFEEYIKKAVRENFGSFFNITELYDSRECKLVLLLEREHIVFTKEFFIPKAKDWGKFPHIVDDFMTSFPNMWNALISQQMIKRQQIYTQSKLINPYFVKTPELRVFYDEKIAEITEQKRLSKDV